MPDERRPGGGVGPSVDKAIHHGRRIDPRRRAANDHGERRNEIELFITVEDHWSRIKDLLDAGHDRRNAIVAQHRHHENQAVVIDAADGVELSDCCTDEGSGRCA